MNKVSIVLLGLLLCGQLFSLRGETVVVTDTVADQSISPLPVPAKKYIDISLTTGGVFSHILEAHYPGQWQTSFLIGASAEYPIDRTRSVSGGLMYTSKGSMFADQKERVAYHYVEVPLYFIQHFPLGKNNPRVRLHLRAGITPSFAVGHTSATQPLPFYLSANIGAGLDIRLVESFLFFLRYEKDFGLTKISENTQYFTQYPRFDSHYLLLGLTYRLNL